MASCSIYIMVTKLSQGSKLGQSSCVVVSVGHQLLTRVFRLSTTFRNQETLKYTTTGTVSIRWQQTTAAQQLPKVGCIVAIPIHIFSFAQQDGD